MRTRRRSDDGPVPPFRGDVDALAARVDDLARIVRDAAGSVTAVQGELARSGRSRSEETSALEKSLGRVQDELAELRRRPAAVPPTAPATPQPPATSAAELAVLSDRVGTLSKIVADNAAQIAAREGGLAAVKTALTEEGVRVDEALNGLRREIAALATRVEAAAAPSPSAAPSEERLDGRITALGDRLDDISGTVRQAASELVAARGEQARTANRIAGIESSLERRTAETRSALMALEREVARVQTHAATAPAMEDPRAEEQTRRLAGSVDALGDRLATISGIVRDSAGRLAAREELTAGIDERLTALSGSVEAIRLELREQRQAAVAEGATSGTPDVAATAAFAAELERLTGRVDSLSSEAGEVDFALHEALAARVDGLAKTQGELATAHGALATIQEALAETQEELAATVAESVTALETGQTELRTEVTESLSALSDEQQALAAAHQDLRDEMSGSVDELTTGQTELRAELALRVTEITTHHERLASDIELVSAVANEALALDRDASDPGPMLRELAAKLERIDSDRRVVAEQLAEAETAWRDEREALQARLEQITFSADGLAPGDDAERLVHELTVRLDRLERDRESVTDIASLAEGWRKSLGTLAARVEYGLIKLSQASEAPAGPAEAQELVDLATRVASMENDRDSVLGELTRATESWATERAALHERVAELAARIVTGPMDLPTATGVASADLGDASQELDRLRIGLEGMRMRLAYHEKTVAEMGGGKLTARLDELTSRLDRLQQVLASGSVGMGAGVPGSDDALLGVDVDGLMRRVEHAERSAYDQRKDMLGHLEKIAAQMDWRLQRLERTEARIIA